MINVGDKVKVVVEALDNTGENVKLVPIEMICKVLSVDENGIGKDFEVIHAHICK